MTEHSDKDPADHSGSGQHAHGGPGPESHGADPTRREAGRRRFLKQAAGASPVLLSLASRPAFGNRCTISGMMSGNASTAPDAEPCEGCTPGYWKVLQHKYDWGPTGYTYCDRFRDVFGFLPAVTGDPAVDDESLTLLQALCLQGGGAVDGCNWRALCRHLVAGLLNSNHPDVNYGYDGGTYYQMVKARILNGECEPLKDDLEMLNERWCTLGGQNGPGSGNRCKVEDRLELDAECHKDCGTPMYTEKDYM